MKKIISIILSAALVLLLSSCSAQKKLIGTWSADGEVLGISTKTEYIFREDGTGNFSGKLGIGVAFDYTVEDDKLTITYNSVLTKTTVYSFKVEKDVLTLISDSETLTLTKQK